MRQIDRSVVGSDGGRYTKMVFPVSDDPYVGSESMWVEAVEDGAYRLRNIPGWASGLALNDVVSGRVANGHLSFRGIVQPGGHSTYRMAAQQPDISLAGSSRVRQLRELGCGFEQLSERVLAMDVPPAVDIFTAYGLLEEGMAAGTWWFDELHCGHDVPKSG